MTTTHASLPYREPEGEGKTAGWAGSDASHERAITERDSGVTAKRHRETLALLGGRGQRGMTVAEVREQTGWHHGQASSALSALHHDGRIVRLAERRGRCHVYVLPLYQGDREAQEHGRSKADKEKHAFIVGYRYGTEAAEWEAEIAYDLWRNSQ